MLFYKNTHIYKTIHYYISNPFNSTYNHTTPQDGEVHVYFNIDFIFIIVVGKWVNLIYEIKYTNYNKWSCGSPFTLESENEISIISKHFMYTSWKSIQLL